jgi:hypothetical protein
MRKPRRFTKLKIAALTIANTGLAAASGINCPTGTGKITQEIWGQETIRNGIVIVPKRLLSNETVGCAMNDGGILPMGAGLSWKFLGGLALISAAGVGAKLIGDNLYARWVRAKVAKNTAAQQEVIISIAKKLENNMPNIPMSARMQIAEKILQSNNLQKFYIDKYIKNQNYQKLERWGLDVDLYIKTGKIDYSASNIGKKYVDKDDVDSLGSSYSLFLGEKGRQKAVEESHKKLALYKEHNDINPAPYDMKVNTPFY